MVKVDLSQTTQTWRGAFHVELRAEAASLASRGWPVLPGTHPQSAAWDSVGTEDSSWEEPTPVQDNWEALLDRNSLHSVDSWRQPYSLLVATGMVLDAVEVSGDVGRRMARFLRSLGQPAPIIAMPNNRWLFLTEVAREVPVALYEHDEVKWHGAGSWIPLPPTPFRSGVVHWRVKPEVCGWRLPQAAALQEVLVHALDESALLVGAQMSTS